MSKKHDNILAFSVLGLLACVVMFLIVDIVAGTKAAKGQVTITHKEYVPPYTTNETVILYDEHGNARTEIRTVRHQSKYLLFTSSGAVHKVSGSMYGQFSIGALATEWARVGYLTGINYNAGITPITLALNPEGNHAN